MVAKLAIERIFFVINLNKLNEAEQLIHLLAADATALEYEYKATPRDLTIAGINNKKIKQIRRVIDCLDDYCHLLEEVSELQERLDELKAI